VRNFLRSLEGKWYGFKFKNHKNKRSYKGEEWYCSMKGCLFENNEGYDGLGFNMKFSTYMNETWIHSVFTVSSVGTTVRQMVLRRTNAVSSG